MPKIVEATRISANFFKKIFDKIFENLFQKRPIYVENRLLATIFGAFLILTDHFWCKKQKNWQFFFFRQKRPNLRFPTPQGVRKFF